VLFCYKSNVSALCTLRHMLASGFSCSTRGGGCGSGGGNRGMSTELLILLPRLLGTLPIPLDARIALFRPRLTRASGSACAGSGSSTSDSVARYTSNNARSILYQSGLPQLISQNTHNYQPQVQSFIWYIAVFSINIIGYSSQNLKNRTQIQKLKFTRVTRRPEMRIHARAATGGGGGEI
jgi:hypothetical protein